MISSDCEAIVFEDSEVEGYRSSVNLSTPYCVSFLMFPCSNAEQDKKEKALGGTICLQTSVR
jgi:hypothetical protein